MSMTLLHRALSIIYILGAIFSLWFTFFAAGIAFDKEETYSTLLFGFFIIVALLFSAFEAWRIREKRSLFQILILYGPVALILIPIISDLSL
jgi:NADH:ubiquinone oxidoreductase subunit 6 (subunit J)